MNTWTGNNPRFRNSTTYPSQKADPEKTDSAGNTVDVRVNMYKPRYYLPESPEGSSIGE